MCLRKWHRFMRRASDKRKPIQVWNWNVNQNSFIHRYTPSPLCTVYVLKTRILFKWSLRFAVKRGHSFNPRIADYVVFMDYGLNKTLPTFFRIDQGVRRRRFCWGRKIEMLHALRIQWSWPSRWTAGKSESCSRIWSIWKNWRIRRGFEYDEILLVSRGRYFMWKGILIEQVLEKGWSKGNPFKPVYLHVPSLILIIFFIRSITSFCNSIGNRLEYPLTASNE